jgi:hypothetical protein
VNNNNNQMNIHILTEGHATKTLKKGNEYGQSQIALTRDIEDCQHTHEHQRSLPKQNGKLVNQMSQQNFSHLNACKNQSIRDKSRN